MLPMPCPLRVFLSGNRILEPRLLAGLNFFHQLPSRCLTIAGLSGFGSFTRSSRPAEGGHECDGFTQGDYEAHRRMGGTNQHYTSYLGTPSGAYLSWNPFRDPQTETIASRSRPGGDDVASSRSTIA
jgi:hypothetical protein